ncbi:hypothetical protein GUJ93_ZPchr0004g38936 [Zizania palustris]|uniref:J domain-containing protein n=1 Tax=Zizania palustris TaxID=103762 RepID=A0A8J5SBH7_ZIZPA|nr:hypothetical protein GUJ93_ZPchr0004g38936 [Zizania palustris]
MTTVVAVASMVLAARSSATATTYHSVASGHRRGHRAEQTGHRTAVGRCHGVCGGDGTEWCYYEVLDLPRDCSPADIKLAFRCLVLSLHPDKQLPGSNTTAAIVAFQELQHVHSVLSDLHERAYYDSHCS